jgi:hypothetical protein
MSSSPFADPRVTHAQPLASISASSDHERVDGDETRWTARTPLIGKAERSPRHGERQSRQPACSFCGLQDSEARPRPVVVGKGNIAICLDCAELALQILT